MHIYKLRSIYIIFFYKDMTPCDTTQRELHKIRQWILIPDTIR